MSIEYHYSASAEIQNTSIIKIDTLLTTVLILIIRIFMSSPVSFLAKKLLLNKDKGEVMHNEETI